MDRERVLSLLDQRKVLSDFLFDNKEELRRVHDIKKVESSSWVLQLADNITLTTRAPASWAPSRPLHEFHGHPPAPQFEQMRAGKLEALFRSSKAIRERIQQQIEASIDQSQSVNPKKRKLNSALSEENVLMYIGKNAREVSSDEEEEEEEEKAEENDEANEEEKERVRAAALETQAVLDGLTVEAPAPDERGSTRQISISFGGGDSSDEEDDVVESD
jgi:hypothetical protein